MGRIDRKELKFTFVLMLTPLIWGFAFSAQVAAADFLGPFTVNAICFLIGAASLIPVMLIFDRAKLTREGRRMLWIGGLVCGLILFTASNMQQYAIQITESAGKPGFITSLYIIIVPVVGIFLRRRVGVWLWIGVALATVGMYFLCIQEGFGSFAPIDILLFLSAFVWSAHIIAIDYFVKHVSAVKLSMMQFLISGAMCVPFAVATETTTVPLLLASAFPLLYRGIASMGVAYTLQVVGQRHVAPAKAAVIFSLESVFSVIGGALFIHEVMTPRSYLGCALIFAGILFSQIPAKDQTPAE